MAWPLVALAAMQIYGQYSANQAQAEAEEKNQKFFDAQAELARAAGIREENIFLRENAYQRGLQTTSFAGANIDVSSGSALYAQAAAGANALDELNAIRYKNEMDVFLARSRGELSADRSRQLRDPFNNLLQAGTTGLSTYAAGANFFRKNPNTYGPKAGGGSLDMGYFNNPSYPGMGSGLGPYAGGNSSSYLGNYKF